ncbi:MULTISPECIES: hypothetical protein [Heyndrickxia]|nr:hypothetical protein [Heyndrickxia coagulans]KYC73746.1 hypothetical protein B4096_2150 [Heyndrickxia coagulans]QPG52875.1 hypothetical protein IR208_12925 [Heyndrickxia coagulans]WNE60895.1 hypothetical protein KIY57_13380 [Heyndrickxia coagulans]
MGEISALESTHGTSFALQSAKTIAASLLERRDKDEGAVSRLFGGENNG